MREKSKKYEWLRQRDRRAAWRVYRFFYSYPGLLEREENRRIYENARSVIIFYYSRKMSLSEKEIFSVLDNFADAENKYEGKPPEPSPDLMKHFLYYEEFEKRIVALILSEELKINE